MSQPTPLYAKPWKALFPSALSCRPYSLPTQRIPQVVDGPSDSSGEEVSHHLLHALLLQERPIHTLQQPS